MEKGIGGKKRVTGPRKKEEENYRRYEKGKSICESLKRTEYPLGNPPYLKKVSRINDRGGKRGQGGGSVELGKDRGGRGDKHVSRGRKQFPGSQSDPLLSLFNIGKRGERIKKGEHARKRTNTKREGI